MQVTVVGAGVIGLTTALVLVEHGHTVRVVATAGGGAITSSIAGAVWFPYRAGPPERVTVWAGRTRTWLEGLLGERDAGVDVLSGYEITAETGDVPPWWAAGLDVARAPAPVTGAPMAWQFRAPRAEPARFLPWLAARTGIAIETRTVVDLAAEPGDVVVNCTGLGARALVGDTRIAPLLGHVVMTEPGGVDVSITVTDDRDPERLFYVIPRRDELVLGGCSTPWPPGEPPVVDPALTARILADARALGFDVGPVRTVRAGLRPYRPEVRLERDADDPRIVHNYGHGGAGFTLCRGCAEDVARLVAAK